MEGCCREVQMLKESYMQEVKTTVSIDAITEAYCLLTSYLREEGKVRSSYDSDKLQKAVLFLAEIIKEGEIGPNKINVDYNTPEHDGTGLA
jgi:hypothetical protein